MKDKILMLVIGILVGAIITALGFMIFGNNKKTNMGRGDDKFRGGRPDNMVMQELPKDVDQSDI